MNWRERHRLLVKLMTLGLSAWKSLGEGVVVGFWIKLTGVGFIRVISTLTEPPAHKLYVNDEFICGADILYARLTGNWTDGMLKQLRRKMYNLQIGEWEYVPGESGRDSLIEATVNGDRVILHDCGMLFVNGLCVSKYEKQLWAEFTSYGPKLHHDLLRSPLLSWKEEKLATSETSWKFWRTVPGFGLITVHSTWGTARRANLTIEYKFVAPASELFRYLNGQWSWSQKCQLRRRLASLNGEDWQCHTAIVEHDETCSSRQLDGDEIRVYESGAVFVHNRLIMTAPRLYRAIHRQVALDDFEHRDD